MTRRQGMSLTEVLVALFVMALGLLAILTLFPLGALQMAQAIQDSRAAQAAANAEAIAQFQLIRTNSNYYYQAGSNPRDFYAGRGAAGVPQLPANYDGPSYPLYVDPIGNSHAFGRLGNTIPRVTPTFADPNVTKDPGSMYRWFSLLDDMEFADNGVPIRASARLRRDHRYTWAYMVRRPNTLDHAVFNVTVVVYAGRPTVPAAAEPSVQASGTAGSNTLTVFNPSAPIRKGTWLLDVTTQGSQASVHAFFYRVVNVVSQPGSLLVETQSSLRANCSQVVVMLGAVDVFEKGSGWQNYNY